jgi:signal transduction histidine kinase
MNSAPDLALLTHAETPVIIVDGFGDVVFANHPAAALTPVTDDTTPLPASGPVNLRQILLPAEREQILESRGPTTVRITLRAAEARASIAECLVVPLTLHASPRRFLIVFQRNSPEVLPVFAREEFLATVAHDLKNPLSAAFSYADALLDTSVGEGLNEKQRQTISRIRATVLRSFDLVRNYQQLAQLRAGALPAPEVPTDLNSIVGTVLEYCWRPDSSSPSLSLSLAPYELPVPVERLPLERVVSNIFSNAVKFTPSGGSIAVTTTRSPDGECSVVIANTGIGIQPEEQHLIFHRFTRGSAAAGTSGSGLGLYIAKSIVDAIGGRISVTSERSPRRPERHDHTADQQTTKERTESGHAAKDQAVEMLTTFAVTLPALR